MAKYGNISNAGSRYKDRKIVKIALIVRSWFPHGGKTTFYGDVCV